MNKTKSVLAAITVLTLIYGAAAAQEPMELPGPEKEHQWLAKFVGRWETNSKGSMGPDSPPIECSGTIESRMIGDFWVVSEMQSTVMGRPMRGLQTIGYDTSKQKFVGTWVDSIMNHLWIYEGTLDEGGDKLTLEAEGPNFMAEGKRTKFRDTFEFKTDNSLVVTSSMLGDDGKWITFMTGESERLATDDR